MKFPKLTAAMLLITATTPMLAAEAKNAEAAASIMDATLPTNVLPEMPRVALNMSSKVQAVMISRPAAEAALPEGPSASTVSQLPVIGTVQRRATDRFNTTDSSHPNNFAICYRMSPRMGLQVIPGDPTPANYKLPVSTIANNTGVTVGMTVRLGKTR